MNRIGACCLITIGIWVVIILCVQFAHYRHICLPGGGKWVLLSMYLCHTVMQVHALHRHMRQGHRCTTWVGQQAEQAVGLPAFLVASYESKLTYQLLPACVMQVVK
jgi:hypothetical protein